MAGYHLCQVCHSLVGDVLQSKPGHHLCQLWGHLMGILMEIETGHCLCWAWGHSEGPLMYTEVGSYLWGVVYLGESLYTEPSMASTCMKFTDL